MYVFEYMYVHNTKLYTHAFLINKGMCKYIDDDDDVYLRLQYGKWFHNHLYVLHETHEPACKA
jgi:phage-related protein